MNKPSNLFWCVRKGDSLSGRVEELINNMDGRCVDIDGFDEMMHELLWVFDEIKPVDEELEKITKSRLQAMDEQLAERENKSKEICSEGEPKNTISAYEYSTMADKEPDFEKRKDIYLEAVNKFPKTAWLWGRLASFLHFHKKDYSSVEEYYIEALSLDPESVATNGNYAIFFKSYKKRL